jgi:DNA polymerase III delta subunit
LLIVNDYLKREIPQQKIIAQTGLHPFVVKKLAAFGQKFSQEKLEKSYEKIFEADFALKSGLGEPKVILTKLICDLCYLS